MTNYSFDPPAKKAMDEAELSELISGLSADEDGIEKAMKIIQEQEALIQQDAEEFQKWRQAMLDDGSNEALRAVERVTGEVLVEPEPEPQPEPEVENQTAEVSEPTSDEIDVEKTGQATEQPQETQDTPADSDQKSEEVSDKTAETDLVEVSEEELLTESTEVENFEIIEESVEVVDNGEYVETSYTAVSVVAEVQKIQVSDSVANVTINAIEARPKKIRQSLSSKFVLGISLATAIFASLITVERALLPQNSWTAIGVLLGVVLGSVAFALQGFQSKSFRQIVESKFGSLGLAWSVGLIASVSAVAVGVSNLARENRLFQDIEVAPALVVDYEIDEITLTVVFATVFAAILAWQPMLRFALLRIIAVFGFFSVFATLLALDGFEFELGDFDYQAFIAGTISALALTLVLGIILQPSFASDHDRNSWAAGEFNARRSRASVLHSVLFVFIPGVLATLFIASGANMGNAEQVAQIGLLVALGIAIMVAAIGVLDSEKLLLRLIGLLLVSAGLIAGEYLTNDWVSNVSTIGSLLLVAIAASALVARVSKGAINKTWVTPVAVILGFVVGWLIENPFGLLDLGFDEYASLSGYGLGIAGSALISGIISLLILEKAEENEDHGIHNLG